MIPIAASSLGYYQRRFGLTDNPHQNAPNRRARRPKDILSSMTGTLFDVSALDLASLQEVIQPADAIPAIPIRLQQEVVLS